MVTNPFHVPNASLGQPYFLGPAMDPRAQAATRFRGHVVSLGMVGHSYGIQEGPLVTVSYDLPCGCMRQL